MAAQGPRCIMEVLERALHCVRRLLQIRHFPMPSIMQVCSAREQSHKKRGRTQPSLDRNLDIDEHVGKYAGMQVQRRVPASWIKAHLTLSEAFGGYQRRRPWPPATRQAAWPNGQHTCIAS